MPISHTAFEKMYFVLILFLFVHIHTFLAAGLAPPPAFAAGLAAAGAAAAFFGAAAAADAALGLPLLPIISALSQHSLIWNETLAAYLQSLAKVTPYRITGMFVVAVVLSLNFTCLFTMQHFFLFFFIFYLLLCILTILWRRWLKRGFQYHLLSGSFKKFAQLRAIINVFVLHPRIVFLIDHTKQIQFLPWWVWGGRRQLRRAAGVFLPPPSWPCLALWTRPRAPLGWCRLWSATERHLMLDIH